MPKRSRSGVVSRPARVVAPISVNGGIGSVATFAPAPTPSVIGELPVLHRGIERLLDRPRQPVDLVHEEHLARLQVGEEATRCRPCAPAPGRRSGRSATPSSSATIRARLVFPSPGGPANRTWSSASPRSTAARIESPSWRLQRVLADELVQPLRAQPRLLLVVFARVRRLDALEVGAGGADHRRETFRAWAIRASGVSPGASRSSMSTSCGVKPRPIRPSRASARGSSVRVMTIGSSVAAARPSRAARR